MFPLVETLRLSGGTVSHLPWHQARFQEAYHVLFDEQPPWSLEGILDDLTLPQGPEIYKIRVLYGLQSWEVDIQPYTPRRVCSLKLVEGGDIDYSLKYTDRSGLEALFQQRGTADDIIIVKDGVLTDCFSSHICFLGPRGWVTPRDVLLPGTTRARLLAEGIITEERITPEELGRYRGWVQINGMIGFDPRRRKNMNVVFGG